MYLSKHLGTEQTVRIVKDVRFTTPPFRPASMRREFPYYQVPERQHVATVALAKGETVADVVRYHYPRAALEQEGE